MPATRWLVRALLVVAVGLLATPGIAVAQTPPGIPQSVAVTAGDGSAIVQWVAPDDDGGATISGYTVTALPGGATASAPGVARAATVSGLTNGIAYRFTVTASNRAGAGTPSAVSDAVTPTATAGAAGTVLVNEDFATSTGSMEPIAGGEWGVSSGRYVLSAPADGGEGVPNANLAVAGPIVTGDFTLTALGSTTATDSPFNDFSLIFGFRDPGHEFCPRGLCASRSGEVSEFTDLMNLHVRVSLTPFAPARLEPGDQFLAGGGRDRRAVVEDRFLLSFQRDATEPGDQWFPACPVDDGLEARALPVGGVDFGLVLAGHRRHPGAVLGG